MQFRKIFFEIQYTNHREKLFEIESILNHIEKYFLMIKIVIISTYFIVPNQKRRTYLF